jgi:YgiT-type zinc finger domain-containing protein
MTSHRDCTFCGGEVQLKRSEYDYRRRGRLLVISNVPAGVCRQCGEKYFQSNVLKNMDEAYHNIFDYHKEPGRVSSPSRSLAALSQPWLRGAPGDAVVLRVAHAGHSAFASFNIASGACAALAPTSPTRLTGSHLRQGGRGRDKF